MLLQQRAPGSGTRSLSPLDLPSPLDLLNPSLKPICSPLPLIAPDSQLFVCYCNCVTVCPCFLFAFANFIIVIIIIITTTFIIFLLSFYTLMCIPWLYIGFVFLHTVQHFGRLWLL